MIIGADELILWLRKNRIAEQVTTVELGQRIQAIILDLGGRQLEPIQDVYWPTAGAAIGPYSLPRQSHQYEIEIAVIAEIYHRIALFQ